jgi:hypothetical protein
MNDQHVARSLLSTKASSVLLCESCELEQEIGGDTVQGIHGHLMIGIAQEISYSVSRALHETGRVIRVCFEYCQQIGSRLETNLVHDGDVQPRVSPHGNGS